MASLSFFHDLDSFSEFTEVVEDHHYRPLPPGWCIVIADIVGSTRAIEEGRYKDVNTIGAAAIASVQNALGKAEFPYVFGGDGATILVPDSFRPVVTAALSSLKNLARTQFDLELRVGIVQASEVFANGHSIDVAKLKLGSGKCVAIFRGGGLTNAEQLVKGHPDKYEVHGGDCSEVDLDGLSCRWNAIPSKNGCILSLLVAATGKNFQKIYADLFEKIHTTIGSVEEANPLNTAAMSYRSTGELARDEARFHAKKSVALFRRLAEILAAVLIFKWKIPPLIFNPSKYVESMLTHSDYRKFDDMLRMIIDCTPAQFEELESYLKTAHHRGDLNYGLFRSKDSLMTCFFQSPSEGDHIHFIDGGDGGYALAAKQLKAQQQSQPER